jgi:hypothetical protein
MGSGSSKADATGSPQASQRSPRSRLKSFQSVENLRSGFDGLAGAQKTAARIDILCADAAFRLDEEEEEFGLVPPLLYVAAGRGQEATITGADDAEVSERHWARMNQLPIHVAALQGSAACVQRLLDKGAQNNATDANELAPIHYAALGDSSVPVLKVLLAGLPAAAVNARTSDGETALLFAAAAKSAEAIRVLVQHGAIVDGVDTNQASPLHVAVLTGDEDCVAELVKDGASIDIADAAGNTPLDCAAALRWGSQRMVAVLNGQPVDVDGDENAWHERGPRRLCWVGTEKY